MSILNDVRLNIGDDDGTAASGTFGSSSFVTVSGSANLLGDIRVNIGDDSETGGGGQLAGSHYLLSSTHLDTVPGTPTSPSVIVSLSGTNLWAILPGTIDGTVLSYTSGSIQFIPIAGVSGVQGPAGPAGPSGAPGPSGETGPQGPIGPSGAQGIQGIQGPSGVAGPSGATGAQGPQGDVGPSGATGPSGLPGQDGATGPQGPPGPIVGWSGVLSVNNWSGPYSPVVQNKLYGLDDIHIASGNQLIWAVNASGNEVAGVLASGSGFIKITDGRDGVGHIIFNSRMPSVWDPLPYDITQALDWLAIATGIPGPSGATGPQGPQGPSGVAGPSGATGADGATGATGPQGPPGPIVGWSGVLNVNNWSGPHDVIIEQPARLFDDLIIASGQPILWSNTSNPSGGFQVGILPSGSGIIKITDGYSGQGYIFYSPSVPTNWSAPVPATIESALDALAKATGILAGNSGNPIQPTEALNQTLVAGNWSGPVPVVAQHAVYANSGLYIPSGVPIEWSNVASASGDPQVGIIPSGSGFIKITDGHAGNGHLLFFSRNQGLWPVLPTDVTQALDLLAANSGDIVGLTNISGLSEVLTRGNWGGLLPIVTEASIHISGSPIIGSGQAILWSNRAIPSGGYQAGILPSGSGFLKITDGSNGLGHIIYSPSNPNDWSAPIPNNIDSALDALVKATGILAGGTGNPLHIIDGISETLIAGNWGGLTPFVLESNTHVSGNNIVGSGSSILWTNRAQPSGGYQLGLVASGSGILRVTDGWSGDGYIFYSPTTPGDWDTGIPATIERALDLLAAATGQGGGGGPSTDGLSEVVARGNWSGPRKVVFQSGIASLNEIGISSGLQIKWGLEASGNFLVGLDIYDSTSLKITNAAGGLASLVVSPNSLYIGDKLAATGIKLSSPQNNLLEIRSSNGSTCNVSVPGFGSLTEVFGYLANAQGTNSMAIGRIAVATASRSIAIGESSLATNSNSIAFGNNANAGGSNSVILGVDANTTQSDAIVIGFAATGVGVRGVGIGSLSIVSGLRAIAIGHNCAVSNSNSIAVGANISLTQRDSVVIGYSAGSPDNESVIIGTLASGGSNAGSIAIGYDAKSAGSAIGLGYKARAASSDAIALGRIASAAGSTIAIGSLSSAADESIVIGKGAIGSTESIVIGDNAFNSGVNNSNNILIGDRASVSGTSRNTNVCIGYDSSFAVDNSITIGYAAYGYGLNSIGIGANLSIINASNAVAIGNKAYLPGNASNSVAIGALAYSAENDNIVVGYNATGILDSSVAIGSTSISSGLRAIAIGTRATNIATNSIAIGAFTYIDSDALNAVAIGFEAAAVTSPGDTGPIAIGYQASGLANKGIAIGYLATTKINSDSSIAIGNASSADGVNNTVVGSTCRSIGNNCIVIGNDSAFSDGGTNIAIGRGAVGGFGNTCDNNIAIGPFAVATSGSGSDKNIAIGVFARNLGANTLSAIAIGETAHNNADNSIAIGGFSQTSGVINAIALGYEATSLAQRSISIGYRAYNRRFDGIAIGSESLVGSVASSGIAIGSSAVTSGNNSIAIGPRANSLSANSIAIGPDAKVKSLTASGSIAIGNNAVGSSDSVTSFNNISIGSYAYSSGANYFDNIAIGNYSNRGNDSGGVSRSIFIGSHNKGTTGALANVASIILIGSSSTANGGETIIIGNDSASAVLGESGIIIGNNSKLNGDRAISIGTNANAFGGDSIAIGQNAATTTNNAFALGLQARASHIGAAAIGFRSVSIARQVYTFGSDSIGISLHAPSGYLRIGHLHGDAVLASGDVWAGGHNQSWLWYNQDSGSLRVADNQGNGIIELNATQSRVTCSGDIVYTGTRIAGTDVFTTSATVRREFSIFRHGASVWPVASLPSAPQSGVVHTIKDGAGLAATNNIMVSGVGKTIDGQDGIPIVNNYGSLTVVYNGTEWSVT